MFIALVDLLFIFFMSLIYMDIPPLIAGLSVRGFDFILDPTNAFLAMLAGQGVYLAVMWLRRRHHGYNVPFFLSAMGAAGVFAGIFISPPLVMAGAVMQAIAWVLDAKTQEAGMEKESKAR